MISLKASRTFHLVLVVVVHTFFLFACQGEPSNQTSTNKSITKVGFDLDDTLLFSTPAFNEAFDRDVRPFSDRFWSVVNSSDREHSCVKPKTLEILKRHQKKEREIYVITARTPSGTKPAKNFIESRFDIPSDHVYFEPDGKADLLRKLKIDRYYGDSDSDIRAAQKAGITGIRIQRSPQSNYDEKYNPGKFDEKVIQRSADHDCSL